MLFLISDGRDFEFRVQPPSFPLRPGVWDFQRFKALTLGPGLEQRLVDGGVLV